MPNDITTLYDRAFACWQRSNRHADPSIRASWEATAHQYIAAALAITKAQMQALEIDDQSAPQNILPMSRNTRATSIGHQSGQPFRMKLIPTTATRITST